MYPTFYLLPHMRPESEIEKRIFTSLQKNVFPRLIQHRFHTFFLFTMILNARFYMELMGMRQMQHHIRHHTSFTVIISASPKIRGTMS